MGGLTLWTNTCRGLETRRVGVWCGLCPTGNNAAWDLHTNYIVPYTCWWWKLLRAPLSKTACWSLLWPAVCMYDYDMAICTSSRPRDTIPHLRFSLRFTLFPYLGFFSLSSVFLTSCEGLRRGCRWSVGGTVTWLPPDNKHLCLKHTYVCCDPLETNLFL